MPETAQHEIARQIGIGAVKYQDLLPNRQSDYVFSWDKMLALAGNTAPYVQYQCARAAKVLRDSGTEISSGSGLNSVELSDATELALARHLLNFGSTLEAVAAECRPNFLCNYLYELAGRFSRFYENCPVLKAEEPLRKSRLVLCELTRRTLVTGLDALGIESPAVM